MNRFDDYDINFNQPTLTGKELYYISEAIHDGYSAGDGKFTQHCHYLLEQELRRIQGVAHNVLH